MIGLAFALPTDRSPVFLFVGAHCDDIEIGCGGTVLELMRRHPTAEVHWVVLSSGQAREEEARNAAGDMLRGCSNTHLHIENFRGSYFPSEQPAIKDYFEKLKGAVNPDVIFTHCREELHQDHRIVGEMTWNTFRNHAIFEYEIPKYDGGLGSPSLFVPISGENVERKVDVLMRRFVSQLDKHWFTRETFVALMRLRGIESHAPSGYAEAFYSRKLVLAT